MLCHEVSEGLCNLDGTLAWKLLLKKMKILLEKSGMK